MTISRTVAQVYFYAEQGYLNWKYYSCRLEESAYGTNIAPNCHPHLQPSLYWSTGLYVLTSLLGSYLQSFYRQRPDAHWNYHKFPSGYHKARLSTWAFSASVETVRLTLFDYGVMLISWGQRSGSVAELHSVDREAGIALSWAPDQRTNVYGCNVRWDLGR